MKKSKKWLVICLLCTQVLGFIPVKAKADVISPVSPKEETSDTEILDSTQESNEGMLENEENESISQDDETTESSVPDENDTGKKGVSTEKIQDSAVGNESPSNETYPNNSTSSSEDQYYYQEDEQASSNFVVYPNEQTQNFILKIAEDARRIGQEQDLYASVMIAQAILESGSGQSLLSQEPYNNLFGIKGTYEGQGVTFETKEDDGEGQLYSVESTFRQYDDLSQSLEDYSNLLKDGLIGDNEFYKGTWKSETNSYKEATEYLTGRYATDVYYNEKLDSIILAYDLAQYDYPKDNDEEYSDAGFNYPIDQPIVSSYFGPRDGGFHRGVDFAVASNTPVKASASGTVVASEYHYSWGNYVAIQHDNGMTTLYAHNNSNLVTVGQQVRQGEVISLSGSTGNSTGPHVHFEVSLSGSLNQSDLIDPLSVLPS